MSIIVMDGTIKNEVQGWFSYSDSSLNKNNKISLSFTPPAINSNNIIINLVKLYITCSSSGKAGKKDFSITYGGTSIPAKKITSNGVAYNRTTSINLDNNDVLTWLKTNNNPLTLTSADPNYNGNSMGSSSSGWFSSNYVKIKKAYIEIDYTIKRAEFTECPSIIKFETDYTIKWNNPNDSYHYSLVATFDSHSQQIFKGTSNDTTVNFLKKTFSTLLENNPAKTSFSGTLYLETFDGSTSLGESEAKITLQTTKESFSPTAAIEITKIKKYGQLDLANYTVFTFSAENSSSSYSNLKEYSWVFSDGTTSTAKSFSKIFSNNSVKTVQLTVTDARGYSSSIQEGISITNYQKPNISKFVPYRVTSETNTTLSDTGRYIYVGPKVRTASYTSSIGSESNTINWSFTLNGSNVTVNPSGVITSKTISADNTAVITATITDSVGNKDSIDFTLPSANYLLHFLKNKNAIGIGCAAVAPASNEIGKITMGWPIKLTEALSIESGGTGASSKVGAAESLGVLPLSGGTLTGDLTLNGTLTLNENLTFDKEKTIYLTDSANQTFKGLYAGAYFYVGIDAYQNIQKHGKTYIGLGGKTDEDGVYTPYTDLFLLQSTVQNGTDGIAHTVLHSGNYTKYTNKISKVSITLNSKFEPYANVAPDDDVSKNDYLADGISLTACGKIVNFVGQITPKTAIASGDTADICTIPAAYRPSSTIVMVCQGSTSHIWTLRIVGETGKVTFSRYRSGSENASCGAGKWLTFNANWIIP